MRRPKITRRDLHAVAAGAAYGLGMYYADRFLTWCKRGWR